MNLDTLSAKELVRHFNALVTASHPTVACIAGDWKGSKAALIAKIQALPKEPVKANREEMMKATTEALAAQAAKAGEPLDTEAAKAAFTFGGKSEDEALADKPTRPATVKGKKEKPAKAEKGPRKGQSDSEVGEYFAKHGLNPKIMRAKLRRAGFNAPYTLDQVKSLKKGE